MGFWNKEVKKAQASALLLADPGDNWGTALADGDESPFGGDPGLIDCWGLELREPVIP